MISKFPIIAKNISFKRGLKTIIQNVSVVLEKNEFVGVIGGSGSGKTTLMNCLNGFLSINKGTLYLNNILSEDKISSSALIGCVPQDDIVHKTLSVERSFYFSYLLRNPNIDKELLHSQINETINILDLNSHKNKKISALSGGQRKRVNIGIELLHSPQLFFLDEPTAGLDPGLERQLMHFLSTLAKKNRVVLVSTHLMQNIDLFDVIIFMHEGRMIYCGPVSCMLKYFQVNNIFEIFDKVANVSSDTLAVTFTQSRIYQEFIVKRLNETLNIHNNS